MQRGSKGRPAASSIMARISLGAFLNGIPPQDQ
jgi:hypothetical protein